MLSAGCDEGRAPGETAELKPKQVDLCIATGCGFGLQVAWLD